MVIKNLVFDVDGVLTDGKYYYNESGKIMKAFNASDSVGMKLARSIGVRLIMISSDPDMSINSKRASDIDVEYYFADWGEKYNVLNSIVDLSETAYIGDCIDDTVVFEKVAVSFAPSSAPKMVRKCAAYVLDSAGGEGCVFEAYQTLREIGFL